MPKISKPPLQTAKNGGRDPSTGRFRPGNRIATGNGVARKAAAFRSQLFDTVSTKDFSEVIRTVVKKAKAGESWACKMIFVNLLGEPVAVDVLTTVAELERAIESLSQ